jgi:hypothetical protein
LDTVTRLAVQAIDRREVAPALGAASGSIPVTRGTRVLSADGRRGSS